MGEGAGLRYPETRKNAPRPMLSRRFTSVLFMLVALYIVAGWVLAVWVDAAARFSIFLYSRPVATTTFLIAALFLSGVALRIMVVDRPARLARAIITEMKEKWVTRERFARGLPVVIAFLLFMAAFTSLKSIIPMVNPYAWDGVLAALDRTIHFGVDPWRWLQPVLGFPIVTFVINVVYNLWFPVMFAILYWQAFSLRDDGLRARYLLAFFLCWIMNGTVLAMMYASVGPCFYGLLFPGVNDFVPLMEYLRAANETYPIWAVATQDMLWRVYQDGGLSYGSGISAMPSLHVAVAFLNMMLAYKVNHTLGHALAAFFIVILIGSVHLGWHYAVDGYVAVIVAAVLWFGLGRVIRV